MNTADGIAEVIPSEKDGNLAQAECPSCGWQGPRHRWWSRAQEGADRHNRKHHPALALPEEEGNA